MVSLGANIGKFSHINLRAFYGVLLCFGCSFQKVFYRGFCVMLQYYMRVLYYNGGLLHKIIS